MVKNADDNNFVKIERIEKFKVLIEKLNYLKRSWATFDHDTAHIKTDLQKKYNKIRLERTTRQYEIYNV